MINIKQLTKKFGTLQVLDQLDLEIEGGGIFAILGPNGSGKTTLIKSILGMVIPNSGLISVAGLKIKSQFQYRNQICYLPQIANFPSNLTVKEMLAMIQDLRSTKANPLPLLEAFNLHPFMQKKLGHLSGGTKQKVNIVLALMFDCPLIILDEPTTGLDPVSVLTLKRILHDERAKGKTILITTHILGFVEEMADQIVFLLDGKIFFKGTKKELELETQQTNLELAIAKILTSQHA